MGRARLLLAIEKKRLSFLRSLISLFCGVYQLEDLVDAVGKLVDVMRPSRYSSTSKKSLVAPTNSCMFLTMRPSFSIRISKRFQGNFMMW